MSMRLVLAAALLVLAAACGDDDPVARDPAPDDPSGASGPLVVVDGEVQVSCDGRAPGWSPSTMRDGIPGVLSEREAIDAFRAMLADPQLGEELRLSEVFPEDPADTEWRVLAEDGERVALGLGAWTEQGAGPGMNYLTMEREGGGWAWTGMATCELEPVLDEDTTWATVSRPDAGLDRDTTTPEVGVSERECTSARDPDEFLHEPYVVEAAGSVTVYWTSQAPTGGQNCPGNPVVTRTLALSAPLGDRELLDGSVWPPAPVEAPPF